MSIVRSSSAWDLLQIEKFLHECVIPVRLACLNVEGAPLVCSLWYLYDEGTLWCATQRSASIIDLLERDPRCGFEIAPEAMPYRGIRGQGRAVLSAAEGPDILRRLIDRYVEASNSEFAAWLLERSASEVAIRIRPGWLTSWDFSTRMQS